MFADLVAVILEGLHIEGAMFQYRTRRQLQNTLLISENRNLPDFTALLKIAILYQIFDFSEIWCQSY
jgi:hypothetical protein